MPSYEPVRALLRGLEVLRRLNECNSVGLDHLYRTTHLPKPTLVRLLETLIDAGYVGRRSDGHYHLTGKVRLLSRGFDETDCLVEVAGPILEALHRVLDRPADLAVFSQDAMVVRQSSRRPGESPSPEPVGQRLPLLASAPGRAYLTWCPDDERIRIVARLARSGSPEDAPAREASRLRQILEETRRRGYAEGDHLPVPAARAIAVPVASGGRVLGCLSMAYLPPRAGGEEALIERCLPPLRQAARDIASGVERQLAGTSGAGAGAGHVFLI